MNMRKEGKNTIGIFGTEYRQFRGKSKEAIKHLLKVKEGECVDAFYRDDIGYVSLVWGKAGTKEKAYKDGYGLAHIVKVHAKELKQLGFEIEDFIPLVFQFGKLDRKKEKIFLNGEMFRLVITTEWFSKQKTFILTAFDLRPINRKNPIRAKEMKNLPKKGR
jgi:hypothetical protein